jgi:hypothetical protein
MIIQMDILTAPAMLNVMLECQLHEDSWDVSKKLTVVSAYPVIGTKVGTCNMIARKEFGVSEGLAHCDDTG